MERAQRVGGGGLLVPRANCGIHRRRTPSCGYSEECDVTLVNYVSYRLLMTNFGILGMILFSANDPFHFLNLHTAIITLFR